MISHNHKVLTIETFKNEGAKIQSSRIRHMDSVRLYGLLMSSRITLVVIDNR